MQYVAVISDTHHEGITVTWEGITMNITSVEKLDPLLEQSEDT